jgi:cell shape-determining protein MreC
MRKLKQLEEELHEQCVLNGKGSEREAALLVNIERLERENAALRQKLELSSNNQTEEYICVDREHGLWKRNNKTS